MRRVVDVHAARDGALDRDLHVERLRLPALERNAVLVADGLAAELDHHVIAVRVPCRLQIAPVVRHRHLDGSRVAAVAGRRRRDRDGRLLVSHLEQRRAVRAIREEALDGGGLAAHVGNERDAGRERVGRAEREDVEGDFLLALRHRDGVRVGGRERVRVRLRQDREVAVRLVVVVRRDVLSADLLLDRDSDVGGIVSLREDELDLLVDGRVRRRLDLDRRVRVALGVREADRRLKRLADRDVRRQVVRIAVVGNARIAEVAEAVQDDLSRLADQGRGSGGHADRVFRLAGDDVDGADAARLHVRRDVRPELDRLVRALDLDLRLVKRPDVEADRVRRRRVELDRGLDLLAGGRDFVGRRREVERLHVEAGAAQVVVGVFSIRLEVEVGRLRRDLAGLGRVVDRPLAERRRREVIGLVLVRGRVRRLRIVLVDGEDDRHREVAGLHVVAEDEVRAVVHGVAAAVFRIRQLAGDVDADLKRVIDVVDQLRGRGDVVEAPGIVGRIALEDAHGEVELSARADRVVGRAVRDLDAALVAGVDPVDVALGRRSGDRRRESGRRECEG